MYSIEKYSDWNPVTETWIPMAFDDPALLHCIMFCVEGYDACGRGTRERPEAIAHMEKAISMVNERLAAPTPDITNATIVVVCTMAYGEVCQIPPLVLSHINDHKHLESQGQYRELENPHEGVEEDG